MMPRTLHLLRQWPQSEWIAQWLSPDSVVIISEQALRAVMAQPELLEQLPVACCHCLRTEVLLLTAAQREQLPAHLLQLADNAWLELSLQCAPVISWGD
ncbi:hypothetical protein [Pseudidiomarina mangrovi]|uniref:hypothetical protein n=1 Tax=Pseudidiomarina mangrovi TaxID=2487133 RepID=UPI000FCCA329|nr:hypothetical protein [Pseudidiomarina mangrovi]CAI8163358.1 MAG: Uncharacterised protein [Pseudidiomarina mangrovi]